MPLVRGLADSFDVPNPATQGGSQKQEPECGDNQAVQHLCKPGSGELSNQSDFEYAYGLEPNDEHP